MLLRVPVPCEPSPPCSNIYKEERAGSGCCEYEPTSTPFQSVDPRPIIICDVQTVLSAAGLTRPPSAPVGDEDHPAAAVPVWLGGAAPGGRMERTTGIPTKNEVLVARDCVETAEDIVPVDARPLEELVVGLTAELGEEPARELDEVLTTLSRLTPVEEDNDPVEDESGDWLVGVDVVDGVPVRLLWTLLPLVVVDCV